uniref:Phage lysin protein endolysin n=2 Tax=Arsenophonus nasoniae TaxID=638 RepID=D2U1M1_9GAMM|nr:phage lysin protein; endolysin [Arsenophonus nasoniae]
MWVYILNLPSNPISSTNERKMTTKRKKDFAASLKNGASQAEAARQAGYTEKYAKQIGSRLAKDEEVLELLNSLEKKVYEDPKDFLIDLLNGAEVSLSMKFEAAKILMPYMHPKLGSIGERVIEEDEEDIYPVFPSPKLN